MKPFRSYAYLQNIPSVAATVQQVLPFWCFWMFLGVSDCCRRCFLLLRPMVAV